MTLPAIEQLILAISDGVPFTQAAAGLRLRHDDAIREARAYGYPDAGAIAEAAATILHDHFSGENEPMPRKPDLVQPEDDPGVEATTEVLVDVADIHIERPSPEPTPEPERAAQLAELLDQPVHPGTHCAGVGLDGDRLTRAICVREAADITRDIGRGPTVWDLVDLAYYIDTGEMPDSKR